jgi:UDP-N-acetylmuramoyl-L-alanyl-D-glutamate--2,6-diaminopimelate ligase
MGALAAQKSNFSVITSDNPRSEDPATILKDIEAGVMPLISQDKYIMITDRKAGIKHALEMAQPGDVILIAGKGHENYQILKDETIHFDDREIALEILKDLGYSS